MIEFSLESCNFVGMDKGKDNTKRLSREERLALLALAAEKLKGREFFPRSNEEAREFLKKVKTS
jgi:hypothetical protein